MTINDRVSIQSRPDSNADLTLIRTVCTVQIASQLPLIDRPAVLRTTSLRLTKRSASPLASARRVLAASGSRSQRLAAARSLCQPPAAASSLCPLGTPSTGRQTARSQQVDVCSAFRERRAARRVMADDVPTL